VATLLFNGATRACQDSNLFPYMEMSMCNVRAFAMLMVLFCVSACASNDFHDAYSVVDLGGVKPIPLDD